MCRSGIAVATTNISHSKSSLELTTQLATLDERTITCSGWCVLLPRQLAVEISQVHGRQPFDQLFKTHRMNLRIKLQGRW